MTPHRAAHALLCAAMVAMVWPVVPGWLSVAATAPAAAWFVGSAAVRRRLADVHHAIMAATMVWMATMPAHSHGGAGPVAGAIAAYFLLAAAPFLSAPLRIGRRGPVLVPLGHGAMSLAMTVLLATGR